MLEVLGEAAVSVEPGQGALYDPATKHDFEVVRLIGALDDLDGPLVDAVQATAKLVSGITAVGEQAAQPGEAGDHTGQQQGRSVAELHVGGVNHGVDQIAFSVGEDVALTALCLLARVITTRPAGFRCFDALAIDATGTGRNFAAVRIARGHQ